MSLYDDNFHKLTQEDREMRRYISVFIKTTVLMSFMSVFATAMANAENCNLSKIKFDLSDIRPNGLRGFGSGLSAVDYEFCIPNDKQHYAAIKHINRTIQIYSGPKGRIGCSKTQLLCIGNTHQPHWKNTLKAIAALPYVKEIDETFFE
jgi:hypothetical protein